jgi:type I restriction enzyme R subunit
MLRTLKVRLNHQEQEMSGKLSPENPNSETITRAVLIDRQLAQAGWSRNKRNLLEEFILKSAEPDPGYGDDQFVDYALLGRDETPIAIIEAKNSSRDALAGKRQSSDYADRAKAKYGFDPFIFLANGKQILFWDRERYPPREVSGFFTLDDLERLKHQRLYAEPLAAVEINSSIVERAYQMEAIRRVTEGIEAAHRKFLLVMATGTGKTRTTIALVDLLLRAKRTQRVLFLADRRELVRQAMTEFKTHLPRESLARIEGGELSGARIHFSTYPSMMQVFERLSVAHYDLIIADESHRSIYRRYKALFDYFDAIQLGLTATPTDYIDHDTFKLFGCDEGIPTFLYGYDQAIQDRYLVNYRVLEAQTRFQLSGIQGDSLPEPLQRMVEDQGVDLEELNFDGTDIERTVTISGTNDAIVREFMERCRKDVLGLPHKTIIFAVSHAHALRLYESFNRLYPDAQRKGLAEVIDSHMERADFTLDDFKFKDMPRVAISVDMLDTGVDVPAIQNLVFAKPVFSRVKFWQMIGRGTRLYTDPRSGEVKKDFLIIDCWNNFAYFKLNPEGETDHPTEPLPVRLFRLRLEKWLLLRGRGEDTGVTVEELRAMVGTLPLENVNVRPHGDEIRALLAHWPEPGEATLRHLGATIAPLMRHVWAWPLVELQFRVLSERIAVAWLGADDGAIEGLAERAREAVANLANNIPEVKKVAEQRAWMLSPGFWQHLDLARITQLQETFAPLMRYRKAKGGKLIELVLPDDIATRRWIIYGPTGEGAFAETYREQVEAAVRGLADQLPGLFKLKHGEALDDGDLAAIADALNQADLFITEETLQQAYRQPATHLPEFLRHILGLAPLPSWEERISTAFDRFIAEHGFLRASQINFLRAVRAAVLRHARLNRDLLVEPPLSRVGNVAQLFRPEEIDEIIAFANRLVEEAA